MNKFEIEYFTDPLCCWSWAMEPQMRKLRYLMKGRLQINYVMGGLLRDWQHFSDGMNNINRPSQFGPLWMEAKQRSGQPIEESIWIDDPVDTSYPACLAVKAAGQQSAIAEEAMLRKLREAVMIKKINIGEVDVLLKIAKELEQKKILDFEKFQKSLFSEEASALFKKDLELSKIRGVSRFPTMLISFGGRTLQITGYRPFEVLLDTFKLLDPGLELPQKIDENDYINSWASLTARELEEISTEEKPEKNPEKIEIEK
ncbi:MAG: DsbA family protein [Salinimicrobium sp.]